MQELLFICTPNDLISSELHLHNIVKEFLNAIFTSTSVIVKGATVPPTEANNRG